MAKRVPIVAIVGRANVGKSSLFNALIGRREAIVADEPGTTRDSISARCQIEGWGPSRTHGDAGHDGDEKRSKPYSNTVTRASQTTTKSSAPNSGSVSGSADEQADMVRVTKDFWLVDTAGMKTAEDDFELTIQEQITEAANSADVILVTVDGTTMITEEDRRVAKLAFKSGKDLILLINKSDKAKKDQIQAFQKLGIRPMIKTSATQKNGFEELEDALDEVLPQATITESDDRIRIALLGRPNVGKSSLYNALAKKQQAIVADRAGTTRDVNHTIIKYKNREIELLDTAGIRRSGKIERGIEQFSVLRSLKAIEEADICLLLIDANELSVALDQKIAGMVKEAGKGLVLAVSKWDTLKEEAVTEITEKKPHVIEKMERSSKKPKKHEKKPVIYDLHTKVSRNLAHDFIFVPWAPLIFTSAVTGKNTTKIYDIALEIMERRAQSITTRELNSWLKGVINRHPPAGLKNRQPKLRYMVQEEGNPIPAFKVFGSQTKFLHWSYKRHMERMMREKWDYIGTPIQLWFIDRDSDKDK